MRFRRYKPKKVLVFDWSANIAYAIGLISTDGNLSTDGNHISFTSNDIELISHMKYIFRMNGKIGYTRNITSESYRLNLCNVQLYDWLLSLGLTPNKSLTIGAIAIPDEFFIDFLRGHLDGDGSITTYSDKYNTFKDPKYVYNRIWLRFISASQDHMIWLQETITRLFSVKGRLHKTKPNAVGNSMFILKYGKKESLTLLSKIYYSNDLPCLSRKRQVYESFLNNH